MKNKKIIYFGLLSLVIPFSIFAAQINGIKEPTGFFDKNSDINSIIKTMIGGILALAVPFLVLAYVYVAFLFAKAQGAADKLKDARSALVWVMVGTAIIVGASTIYSVIEDTLSEANIKTVVIENNKQV